MSEGLQEESIKRTVYCKGFPKDGSITLDVLLEYFKQFGEFDSIRVSLSPGCLLLVTVEHSWKKILISFICHPNWTQFFRATIIAYILLKLFSYTPTLQIRNYSDKTTNVQGFKGSVLVVFKTVELAKSFLERPPVQYKKTYLIRKWFADYLDEKKKEVEERRAKKQAKLDKTGTEGGQVINTSLVNTRMLLVLEGHVCVCV